MDLNLKDKVFIVTGGAKGIGEGIVRAIAEEGGIPVIVGRSQETGNKLADELKKQGTECLSLTRELSVVDNCETAIEDTVRKYQRIDGLINNAGRDDGINLEMGHPEAFIHSIYNNLYHYYNMAHFALPELKKTQGTILNISSRIALTGQGSTSAYSASKGGQLALTREWAVELAKYKIRVNAIVPADVMTPSYRRWLDSLDNSEEILNQIERNIPFGNRMSTPQEIANMAIFLLSERASHMTGQIVSVDGGYVHLDRAMSILNP